MQELIESVFGAGSSIELHLYCGTGIGAREDLGLWEDINALTDQRIRRRLVLSYRGNAGLDARALAAGFSDSGWEVRAYPQPSDHHPLEFLIVDRELAWVGGASQSSRQLNRLVTDAATVEAIVSDLRNLWAASVSADSELLFSATSALVGIDSRTWERVLVGLQENPEEMYRLEPRQFEELVGELLSRQGYQVTLTPMSRDGGRDLLVASQSGLGDFLYLVECKRFAAHRPVSIGIVQRLYGVVAAERATAGIVVTTSSFSRPARDYQSALARQLSLIEYGDLKRWIDLAIRRGAG